MKKLFVILIAIIGLGISANAQNWQGVVNHNGYQCYYQGTSSNPTILAALGKDIGGYTILQVKFKIPYQYSNSGATAWVRQDGTMTAMNYQNGWVYLSYYVYGQTARNFVFTVYENNKTSGEGRNTIIDTHTDRLNLSNMPINKREFETYW